MGDKFGSPYKKEVKINGQCSTTLIYGEDCSKSQSKTLFYTDNVGKLETAIKGVEKIFQRRLLGVPVSPSTPRKPE